MHLDSGSSRLAVPLRVLQDLADPLEQQVHLEVA